MPLPSSWSNHVPLLCPLIFTERLPFEPKRSSRGVERRLLGSPKSWSATVSISSAKSFTARLYCTSRWFDKSSWPLPVALVERFSNKIKHYRAVATRYDKRADNFRPGVKLVSIRIWMRFNESMT